MSGGNILDTTTRGGIEYTVEHFAPPVLLVLGHELDVVEAGVRRTCWPGLGSSPRRARS